MNENTANNGRHSTCEISSPRRSFRLRLAPWLCALLALAQSFGANLIIVPMNRLVELQICREYHLQHNPTLVGPGGSVDEVDCKEKNIQIKLAWIIGVISALGLVCEFLVTVPFGYVSDRYGRRLVLFANAAAVLLSFSWVMAVGYFWNKFRVEAIMVAPLFYLFGGSVNVASTNILAIIADVAKDTSQRTRIFSYQQVVGAVLRLSGPAFSSVALSRNLWLPFWIGIASFSLSFPMIAAIPETRRVYKLIDSDSGSSTEDQDEEVAEGGRLLGEAAESADYGTIPNARKLAIRRTICGFCQCFRKEISTFRQLFWHSRNMSLILVAFLVTNQARTAANIMVQYISYRYDWTIAQAGYLLTVKAGVSLLLFSCLIPLFLRSAREWRHLSDIAANVFGAQVSIILLISGSLLIGTSPGIFELVYSMVIFGLGTGLSLFMLSLMTSETFGVLDDQHTARVYSAVGLVETAGEMVGLPLISGTWAAGCKIGGVGLGLPFFVCSGLYMIAGVAIWNLSMRNPTTLVQVLHI